MKKLDLNKKTIASLNKDSLKNVKGGIAGPAIFPATFKLNCIRETLDAYACYSKTMPSTPNAYCGDQPFR